MILLRAVLALVAGFLFACIVCRAVAPQRVRDVLAQGDQQGGWIAALGVAVMALVAVL